MHVVCVSIVLPFDLAPLLSGVIFLTTGITICIETNDEAIWLYPKYAPADNNCGNAYSSKGDYDRAISDYDQAIGLDAKYCVATTAAAPYEAKNDSDHAIVDFDQALKLDPSLVAAQRGRERVQVLLAKRSNPGAQTHTPAR